MILQLYDVFEVLGKKECMEMTLDFSSTALQMRSRSFPVLIEEPLQFRGAVENNAGVVRLAYEASFTIDGSCDRCLTRVVMPCVESFSHVLIRMQDPPVQDALIVEEGEIDLFSVVFADLLLNLPHKFLCGEDCAGLCVICGANQNQKTCDCAKKTDPLVDPRLASLSALLEQQPES